MLRESEHRNLWDRLSLPDLVERYPGRRRFNDWIVLGAKRYQVDCHRVGLGQIVELDGWETHHTRSAFQDDRERDRRLKVAGYSVTHITWNQLRDEPEAIASDLQVLLQIGR
jgi:very-short-patch-repair endonuclease